MLKKWVSRLWNRRRRAGRLEVNLPVRTTDSHGKPFDLTSLDVSERGLRLQLESGGLGDIVGHRDEVPLEIGLNEEAPPVRAEARLVWAYNTAQGGPSRGGGS